MVPSAMLGTLENLAHAETMCRLGAERAQCLFRVYLAEACPGLGCTETWVSRSCGYTLHGIVTFGR
jgi:hypothetical protein